MADMLSRARYDDVEEMISDSENVGTDFYSDAHATNGYECHVFALEHFVNDEYDGEWLQIGQYFPPLHTLGR